MISYVLWDSGTHRWSYLVRKFVHHWYGLLASVQWIQRTDPFTKKVLVLMNGQMSNDSLSKYSLLYALACSRVAVLGSYIPNIKDFNIKDIRTVISCLCS